MASRYPTLSRQLIALTLLLCAGGRASAVQEAGTSACHTLAGQVTRSLMARPISLREGRGGLHQKVTTQSAEAQAYYDQGISLLVSYVWVDAARSFHQALRHDPELAMAHLGLAKAFHGALAAEEAWSHLRKAQELAGKGTVTAKEAKWIELGIQQMEALQAPRDERAEKHRLYKQEIEKLIAMDLADPHAWVLRGNAEEARPAGRGQGGGVGSVAYYEAALERDPANMAAHHFLVHSLENIKQPERALTHCLEYLAAARGVPHAHHMCGHILPRLGRWHEALSYFQTAHRLHEQDQKAEGIDPAEDWHWGHNLVLLGTVHLRLGQTKEAEQRFRDACDIAPRTVFGGVTCSALLEYLVAEGRFEEALQAGREIEQLPATFARVIAASLSGEAMLALNRPAEAQRALDRTRALKDVLAKEAKGTAGEETVPGYVDYYYIQILETELALREKDPKAAEEKLLEIADDLLASPVVDSWAIGIFQVERMAGHAERAGRLDLAKSLRDRILKIDPGFPFKAAAKTMPAEQVVGRHEDGDPVLPKGFEEPVECVGCPEIEAESGLVEEESTGPLQAISELAGKVAGEVARLAESRERAVSKPSGLEEGKGRLPRPAGTPSGAGRSVLYI